MPTAHPLEEMFLRTTYRVRLPRGGFAGIRVGDPLPKGLMDLLPDAKAEWGFITACNPRGHTRPRDINRRALRKLRDDLRQMAPDAIVRAGCGTLGNWREPSLFVAGLGLEKLDKLMQQHDQLAIVYGRGSNPAQLHWTPWVEHGDIEL